MKVVITIIVGLTLIYTHTACAQLKADRIDLGGIWKARVDKEKMGDVNEYFAPRTNLPDWQEVTLPCTFEPLGPGMAEYHGTCWFRRNVSIPNHWRKRRVVIHFEGVNNQSAIWVNGVLAGRTIDPFLPADIDITHRLRFGHENVIVVRVNNEDPPVSGMPTYFGWRSEGGIMRKVELRASEWVFIDQIKTLAEPAQTGGRFELSVTVQNELHSDRSLHLNAKLIDPGSKVIASFKGQSLSIPARGKYDWKVTANLDCVQLWTPDTPELYSLQVDLIQDGQVIQTQQQRIGFRKIETRGTQILLNGQPIYMIGFNRHEDTHLAGMATDLPTLRRDLEDIKAMGANFIRLCHYPHDRLEIDMCDELGLLVMCEIPFYMCNWDGATGVIDIRDPKTNTMVTASAERQLRTLIKRDRNHPSVVFWSVGNECNEEVAEVRELTNRLLKLAKTLDPSRLVTHVSIQTIWTRPDLNTHEFDDVLGCNAYGYMNFGTNARTYFDDSFDAMHTKYPNKPLLVTEFGNHHIKNPLGKTPKEIGGERQADAVTYDTDCFYDYLTKPGEKRSYICGWAIWVYADHRWPPPAKFIAEAKGVSPYGLYSRDRKEGLGVGAARAAFKKFNGHLVGRERTDVKSLEPALAGQNP